MKNSQ